VYGVR